VPSEFLPRLAVLAEHAATVNWAAAGLGAATLALTLLMPKLTKRVPSTIVALLGATLLVAMFKLPVETIGTRFGGIPTGMPALMWPDLKAEHILPLLPSAFTVALLAAVESLLSAVVADSMTGDRHNSNVELVAQGIANFCSPLFGGIPATGAIARTATNIRSGAQTPLAGIIHALTLLGILLVAAPLARFVPLSALAAILFVVAYNMGEWREIPVILRLGKADVSVWLVTFLLTVMADLTIAVGVGLGLAALLYIYRVADTTTVATVDDAYIRDGLPHVLQGRIIPPYVTLLRIHGPFLFGTTEKLFEATADLSSFGEVVVLRLRNMTAIDASGVYALRQLGKRLRESGREMVICGALRQPLKLLQSSSFLERLGEANLVVNVQDALNRAAELHEQKQRLAG
jgi:SulP family sulfate permease